MVQGVKNSRGATAPPTPLLPVPLGAQKLVLLNTISGDGLIFINATKKYYRMVIDGVFSYFSFIEYRFVSTFSLSISNHGTTAPLHPAKPQVRYEIEVAKPAEKMVRNRGTEPLE